MWRTNETRHIKWHETCKYKCRLDASACNNKQRGNEDKCRYECKELIDKSVYVKGFIWNPSNCECNCDKSCDIGEYLDYSNCKCRKQLFDKLIEERTENIDKIEIASENEYTCSSCTLYIVLFSIVFTINVGIGIYFVYSHWYLKKDDARVMLDTCTEATIYWDLYKWNKLKK